MDFARLLQKPHGLEVSVQHPSISKSGSEGFWCSTQVKVQVGFRKAPQAPSLRIVGIRKSGEAIMLLGMAPEFIVVFVKRKSWSAWKRL